MNHNINIFKKNNIDRFKRYNKKAIEVLNNGDFKEAIEGETFKKMYHINTNGNKLIMELKDNYMDIHKKNIPLKRFKIKKLTDKLQKAYEIVHNNNIDIIEKNVKIREEKERYIKRMELHNSPYYKEYSIPQKLDINPTIQICETNWGVGYTIDTRKNPFVDKNKVEKYLR